MEKVDPQVHAPRFWSKAKVLDDHSCWEWLGNKDMKGYGVFTPVKGFSIRAHRKGRDYVAHGESHGRSKLTWDDVLVILDSPLSARVLGDRFGVSAGTIQRVRSGKSWLFRDNAAAR